MRRAAEIAVGEICKFLETDGGMEEVRLVVFSDESREAVSAALDGV